YVQSKTHSIITYLRGQWYPKSKKVIPLSMLEKHFTEESLAWWYMDDRHLNIKNNTPKKIILSTDSFTIEENSYLIALLYEEYKLQFSIDQQNRIILYDQSQIRYFLHLISPHIHRSMYRKTIMYSLYSSIHKDKRTTIYLSQLIKILKPTFEINNVLSN